jgi:hypothetical protein
MSGIKKVEWATGSRFKVAPEKALRCLESIRAKNGGIITADAVLEDAKRKRSPIHNEFEWDDSIAAHEHRREAARTMTRSLRVVREEAPNVSARQYELQVVSSEQADKRGIPARSYRTTVDILKDPVERDRLIARAIRELAAFRDRYAGISELAVVFSAIDDISAA